MSDGALLTTGLFVKESNQHRIVVEDTGQLGMVLSYIKKFLMDRGYEVTLDTALNHLLELFQEERAISRRISEGRTDVDGENWDLLSAEDLAELGLKRRLFDYQLNAVKHALSIKQAANFSVPGSGKTVIALTVFGVLRKKEIVKRLLVIGPASSFAPWEDEFRLTFGYSPKVIRLIGPRHERTERLNALEDADLVLCTYQMAHRERDNLIKILNSGSYMLVLDESHHIKSIELGPWAATALELAPFATRRIILTGTPAPHSPLDLWSQFTFLWPSQAVLGNRSQFEQRIIRSPQYTQELKQILNPYFTRIKKSDLNLPRPGTFFDRISYNQIPKRQRLILRLLELKTLQEAKMLGLRGADLTTLRRWRRAKAIRLLQAASNPALLSTSLPALGPEGASLDNDPVLTESLRNYSEHEIPAKISYVTQKVRQLVAQGNKVVVWATFIENLHLLNKLLKDLQPLLVYGGVPPYAEDNDPDFESREENINKFKTDPNRRVLLANPAACSESVSLHKVCHDAIYLERTFNCAHFLQSMDRIHRIGMPPEAQVNYHIPLLDCAIEQIVNRRLSDRQRALYDILNDDMPVLGDEADQLIVERDEDLEELFQQLMEEISANATRYSDVPSEDRPPGRTM